MKKITLKMKQAIPLNDDLKARVLAVRQLLPTSGVTSLLVFQYPELDTKKQRSHIANVLQLRSTDQDITEKLEALAEKLKTVTN